jgi:hypothetical protein
VCVVDHHDGSVLFGEASTSSGSGPISPSIENTPSVISSLRPGLTVELRQNAFRRGCVLVGKDVYLRARKAAAVDDAGVIQLVGNNVVFGSQHGRHGAGVRREPD